MVKIREAHSIGDALPNGVDEWLARIPGLEDPQNYPRLPEAIGRVLQAYPVGVDDVRRQARLAACMDILETLHALRLDEEALLAGLFLTPLADRRLSVNAVAELAGTRVQAITEGVARMDALRFEGGAGGRKGGFASQQRQAENLRRMLVAMIDDPRVALVKLAERVQALHACRSAPDSCAETAREAMDVYAPLAHRLGVGHIKWELEDLAFRYLHPDDYRGIARLLDERRVDREQFIRDAVERLHSALDAAGIRSDISGRPKHLFSIWRKMQRKGIGISEVYDVRALRVIVGSIADCYSTLGIVHGLWRNLPGEFDDYVANPKPNGYRSLHTAVIGDGGKVLEVQIRTQEMHEEAELGICAHWRYKGSEAARVRSSGYEEKIDWLRQVLGWGEDLQAGELISEHLRREVGEDRIYVLTPDGHVVDLPRGATPVDFAYHVHTEVGHRCRGAKVDGRIVSLDYVLHTGERVEILTGRQSAPNRDWLLAGNEFVHTARARSKIRNWFRQQDRERLVDAGRGILDREMRRLALPRPELPRLLRELGFDDEDDLLAALGSGDFGIGQLISAMNPPELEQPQPPIIPRTTRRSGGGGSVSVAGVDNLLTHYAGCCKPLPGEPIAGYVTDGRGVSVHRRDCPKLLALGERAPARIVSVAWQRSPERLHAVDIKVVAHDRSGLLRDIVTLLGNERINILDLNTSVERVKQIATSRLTVEVPSLENLRRVMEKLGRISGVLTVGRNIE